MTEKAEAIGIGLPNLMAAADTAARHIPPLWPLASSVAVNPYLGQSGDRLATAGARLARIGGTPITMPREWYQDKISRNEVTVEDLASALEASPHHGKPNDVQTLMSALSTPKEPKAALATIADLSIQVSGVDWPGLIAERFGSWAGGYFDRGQALWAAPRGKSAWSAWRAYATHDLTPEIMGLEGFAAFVADASDRPEQAIARAVDRLGIGEAALATYFHQLLHTLGGWAQYARQELWRAELSGETDQTIFDFLAIRLLWEEALFSQHAVRIGSDWDVIRATHAAPIEPSASEIVDEILQEAAERAAQRQLAETLANPVPRVEDTRPSLQAAFCIDVRSEVFRRALEGVDPTIRTLGFAGFFGLSTKHKGFASDAEEMRLPALLSATVSSSSSDAGQTAVELAARYAARAKRAWGRFKLAAVSSFAFVEAMGPVYAAELVRDSLGFSPKAAPGGSAPRFDPELDMDARIDAATKILHAMSLTETFARVVLVTGHGANVVNNPHASALHCGACGGYSGEVNARLLAGLLNDRDVRAGLSTRGIDIPADTVFIAALHDTTTDIVTLFDEDAPTASHAKDIDRVREWLATAGMAARTERCLRLPRAKDGAGLIDRARNWAEVRPEWGLAGCKAFIAAPRRRTTGRNLAGRSFLHDYDWKQDSATGFGVLELIMTAPVVVASWISLQYYGSTVAPASFGAGNKLLHNVVGGIGVLEGNGGNLRAGLPWQSVHDGDAHVHDPLRLSVCIEAPREAMTDILRRHDAVRALFDNRWLHLFAIGEDGGLSHRYVGNLSWEPLPVRRVPDQDKVA